MCQEEESPIVAVLGAAETDGLLYGEDGDPCIISTPLKTKTPRSRHVSCNFCRRDVSELGIEQLLFSTISASDGPPQGMAGGRPDLTEGGTYRPSKPDVWPPGGTATAQAHHLP